MRRRSYFHTASIRFACTTARAEGQKLLFTPGPLNTSESVKEVMQKDWGSRDIYFINVVKTIRKELLDIVWPSWHPASLLPRYITPVPFVLDQHFPASTFPQTLAANTLQYQLQTS